MLKKGKKSSSCEIQRGTKGPVIIYRWVREYLGLDKVKFSRSPLWMLLHWSEPPNNFWWLSRNPHPPCLQFPSKFEWWSPFWIHPKFTAISALGSQLRPTDPPFCSPKNQVTPTPPPPPKKNNKIFRPRVECASGNFKPNWEDGFKKSVPVANFDFVSDFVSDFAVLKYNNKFSGNCLTSRFWSYFNYYQMILT